VTGFTDAEGSFGIITVRNSELRVGWEVRPVFSISLHKKDLALLKSLQAFFGGVGRITEKHGKDTAQYVVTGIVALTEIVSHFDKYPLISQKLADYLLFKRVFDMYTQKAHLTYEGLLEIFSIKASLNLGVNSELKENFPDLVPAPRPVVDNLADLDGD
jgi:hypothetical protein